MIEINLRDVLNEGQDYVVEAKEKYGFDIRAFRHKKATDTCWQKLDVLCEEFPDEDWTVDRIVKMVFFSTGGKLYGVTFPELGTRENPERFSDRDLWAILSNSKKNVPRIYNSVHPYGMERGTCTPLVPDYVFESGNYPMRVGKIFIHDAPWLEDKIVDISIGGYGDDAHKTSVHLPYYGIYDILVGKFGEEKIVKENILVD